MVVQNRDLKAQVTRSDWFRSLSRYEKPDLQKAIWQLINTLIPYAALWVAMVIMVQHRVSYWFIAPLVVLASGLLVRVYIFFHDCGHSSFFQSRWANRIVGYFCGILTFTPYDEWRQAHAAHHASSGNLDRRGEGDIWTLTVEEYLSRPRWKRMLYRLYRNPLVLFGIGTPFVFLVAQRFPAPNVSKAARISVYLTDLAILAIVAAAALTIGLRTYLLIQLPIIFIAGFMGVWLFYVQHQYDGVYWARNPEWDPIRAAIKGSSYYKLPKVLQWFSGNIGLHHIHHLRPRIANYNLQRCFDEIPPLQEANPLTMLSSLGCLSLNLWDERQQRMVSFKALKVYSPTR